MSWIQGLALVVALTAGSVSAVRGEGRDSMPHRPAPTLYERIVDAVLVRPLGLLPVAVAPIGCAIGLPVAWAMGSALDEADVCLYGPARYVFKRPLGEF